MRLRLVAVIRERFYPNARLIDRDSAGDVLLSSVRTATAYSFTVGDIRTYYVLAGHAGTRSEFEWPAWNHSAGEWGLVARRG